MNKKIKIIISYLLVIVWLAVIFYLSSMDNNESNYKSKKTINTVITATSHELKDSEAEENIVVSDGIEEIKQNFDINDFVEKINPYIRKCTHAFVYMVLAILLLNALKSNTCTDKKVFLITIIFCMFYAMTDEYHQTFVNGRTGRVLDVFIDTVGATIGCGIYFVIAKIIDKIAKK